MLWGGTWGSLWGGATSPRYAPDTVYAAASGDVATDVGGYLTDITSGGGFVAYESPSARANLPDLRTVDLVVQFSDATDTGYLWAWHNASLSIDAGELLFEVNGSNVHSHTLENVTPSTTERWVISWATEPNPLTAGAGDAYRSEVHVWNTSLGTYESSTFTHAAQTSNASADLVWGAADVFGSDEFNGTIEQVRLSSRFHSSTETANCYVAVPSEPTLHGVERVEWPVPTRDCGIGDEGQLVGPVYAMAAKAQQANDLRLMGPLVDEVCTGAWATDSTRTMVDPLDDDFTWHLEFLRRRPLPKQATGLVVSVQLQVDGADQISVRAYVSNRPGVAKPDSSPVQSVRNIATVSRSVDDGGGDTGGAWLETDPIQVTADDQGCVYVWLGFAERDGGAAYRVRAWSVEPVFEEA